MALAQRQSVSFTLETTRSPTRFCWPAPYWWSNIVLNTHLVIEEFASAEALSLKPQLGAALRDLNGAYSWRYQKMMRKESVYYWRRKIKSKTNSARHKNHRLACLNQ